MDLSSLAGGTLKRLVPTIAFLFIASVAQAQVTYISPKIGTGTEADPFRAHRGGSRMVCMPLADTHFLCRGSSVPVATGVIALSTDASSRLTAKQKADLQAVTGKVVAADTFEALITDILDTKEIVLPPQKDNRQHLRIDGVELWSRPAPLRAFVPGVLKKLDAAFHLPVTIPTYVVSTAVAWAASFTEDFNCTNHASVLDCDLDWTTFSGTSAITSNQAVLSHSATPTYTRAEVEVTTTHYEASVDIEAFTLSGTASSCGPMIAQDGTSDPTFYTMQVSLASVGELNFRRLARRNSGSNVTLAEDTTDWVAGDRHTVRNDEAANEVSGDVNGVAVFGPTSGGATPPTGNFGGLRANGTGGSPQTCVMDNYEIKDVAAASATFAPLRRRAF